MLMSEFTVAPLSSDTWDAFAGLAERHNGVWGGCWCVWFHPDYPEKRQSAEGNRALKQRLVAEDKAHAALVFDGDRAVGWCQYGSPEELPNTITASRWRQKRSKRPTIGSPVSSSTGATGDRESRKSH